ncbi:MAG: PilZ domain-containing protein [Acidobacteriota bacterium]|nr:MAG: PilZ domain-containing protein [Acidobacteriota bacterium]
MKERREHPRFPARLPVKTTGPEGEFELVTGDVSLGGIKCHTSHHIPEMTRMALRIELPLEEGSEWITPKGVVVRIEPSEPVPGHSDYRVALFFLELSDADRAKLSRYLDRHHIMK